MSWMSRIFPIPFPRGTMWRGLSDPCCRAGADAMHYKITLQEHHGSWVYVITFGKDTPTGINEVGAYSDNCVSAEDLHAVRHQVYFKAGKIVQIQLHNALRILP